jgi:hypothetical protein
MKQEDEVILERRLTTLELGLEELKHKSDERLAIITARFDKLDRRAAWWVNGIFAVALAAGGIYLEAYLNKDGSRDLDKPSAVELRDDT